MPTIDEALQIAMHHHQAGRLSDAEQIYRQILAVDENHADAWHLLGVIQYQRKHFQESLQNIERAIELKIKTIHELQSLLTHKSQTFQSHVAAASIQDQLNVQQSSLADYYNNRGLVLNDIDQFEDAVTSYHHALVLRPDHAETLNNLGNALYNLCQFDDAITYGRRALHLNPEDPVACNNLATSLKEVGDLDEAVRLYNKAIQNRPGYVNACYNLSLIKLLIGNWTEGWLEFESRWHAKNSAGPLPQFNQPIWNGEPLTDKTILLCAEQGLGDSIQFIRYTREINERGGKVMLVCPKALISLFSRLSTIDYILEPHRPHPKFDYYISLMSLPRIFKTSLETIPASVPYLEADPKLVKAWQMRLQVLSGFRIGINWHGREKRGVWQMRNVPLQFFSPLSKMSGVKLFSLQKGTGSKADAEIVNHLNIYSFDDQLDTTNGPFMDTAAIMKNLDLVITSDTSIAHLAGALGVPVWVALPYVPDWRWLLDREDSPWYPTMRLFRQTKCGEWGDVLERMADALDLLINSGMKT